jgi:hypothetical protein
VLRTCNRKLAAWVRDTFAGTKLVPGVGTLVIGFPGPIPRSSDRTWGPRGGTGPGYLGTGPGNHGAGCQDPASGPGDLGAGPQVSRTDPEDPGTGPGYLGTGPEEAGAASGGCGAGPGDPGAVLGNQSTGLGIPGAVTRYLGPLPWDPRTGFPGPQDPSV